MTRLSQLPKADRSWQKFAVSAALAISVGVSCQPRYEGPRYAPYVPYGYPPPPGHAQPQAHASGAAGGAQGKAPRANAPRPAGPGGLRQTPPRPSHATVNPGPAGPPVPPPSSAADYRTPLPNRMLAASEPAMQIARLSPSACMRQLRRRKLPAIPNGKAVPGVATPMRITGPFYGVRLKTPRAPSPFGILDCRLALALGEMAYVLSHHHVVEVRIDGMYRKGARIGGSGKPSQHARGLAADVMAFTLSNGRELKVKGTWGAPIGAKPCGPDAPMTGGADARWMRTALCALAARGIFNHILTPSANAAHLDHHHFDIKRGSRSRWIR